MMNNDVNECHRFPSALTLWHHVQDEGLAGVGFILVDGIHEDTVEGTHVGSRVVQGHVVHVDGAIL